MGKITEAGSLAAGPGRQVSRRGFVGGAAALAAGVAAVTSSGTAWARTARVLSARGARVRLTLSGPTGCFDIGTIALHLVDHSRQDPFLPDPKARELMISIWYPAFEAGRFPLAPWIPPEAVALLGAGLDPAATGASDRTRRERGYPAGAAACDSGGQCGLPGRSCPARGPGGAERDRQPGAALLSWRRDGPGIRHRSGGDLPSHGYVVVTIDHTYEAPEVVFPSGRVEVKVNPQPPITTVLTTRIADARFVLSSLAILATGGNPDATAAGCRSAWLASWTCLGPGCSVTRWAGTPRPGDGR